MNSKSRTEHVVVVGAGIIGIACAHYLSRAGLRVTVVDKGKVGGACSHANCGYICPSHVLPLTEPGAIRVALGSLVTPNAPFRVMPQCSPAFWNWMWQFARRCTHRQMLASGAHLQPLLVSSMAEYRRLLDEDDLDCEWRESGLLYVFKSKRGFEEFEKTDRFLRDHFGVAARRIDGSDLPQFDPTLKSGLAGAFHYQDDAFLRPESLASAWSKRLMSRGAKFRENCELKGMAKSNGRMLRVRTSAGEIAADGFVFATGAWSPMWSKELGCPIPIQPGKGYSVTMARPDPCPLYPMLFPERKVGVTPFSNGYRLGSMMEFVGYDESIPERRIDLLRRSAGDYLVAPFTDDVQDTWYGFRPMTWDSLPIIGRVPGLANAFLATGHNMLGMSLATATGKLIAELLGGHPTHIDAAPYTPQRFR